MRMLDAFDETLDAAEAAGMNNILFDIEGMEFDHLVSMRERITPEFSQAKIGRWLGWAQAMVVAANVGLTLEDMKRINESHKDV